jgi:hypothetical protein
MFKSIKSKLAVALAAVMAISFILLPQSQTEASDHFDATLVASFPAADIADAYLFNDPNDNTKVCLIMTVDGFVVPGEVGNKGFFSRDVKFEFQIENTGDAKPDLFIDVTFSPLTVSSSGAKLPQTATVKFSSGQSFTAPTTVPGIGETATPFTVTTDPKTGVSFYAGLQDDPFFFDAVGFDRFVNTIIAGSPDPTQLQRGRDVFAGYNVHGIALDVPFSLLKGTNGSKIGLNAVTFVNKKTVLDGKGGSTGEGKFIQFDRAATPGVNTVLIPFDMKNLYNASTPEDDAAGEFAPAIEATLKAVGTNSSNIGTLASVAVTNGDYLRLDNSIANTTLGVNEKFGSPGYVGFPNGRRPGDDVIATIILLVSNETISTGDNVPTNDVPFGSTFPFLAPTHQPQAAGASVGADGTEN